MVFIWFWRHKRLNEVYITVNSLSNDLLSHNSVEKNVKLDNDLLKIIWFIGLFLSDEESILFLQNVLNFTDDMGPPNNLPVLFWVEWFFVQPFLKTFQQVCCAIVRDGAQKFVFVDDFNTFLENLFLTFQLFWFSWNVVCLKNSSSIVKFWISFVFNDWEGLEFSNWWDGFLK